MYIDVSVVDDRVYIDVSVVDDRVYIDVSEGKSQHVNVYYPLNDGDLKSWHHVCFITL